MDNILYVVTEEGTLYSLIGDKGNLLWKYNDKDKGETSARAFPPLVMEHTVYFACKNGNIYAMTENGEIKWIYETNSIISSSPAVYAGVLYTGTLDGTIYAIDISKGEKKWSLHTGGLCASSPVIYGGMLFIGSDNIFYVIDIERGKKRWAYILEKPVCSSPAIYNGAIYVSAGYIYCLDIINGAKRWIAEVEGDPLMETPVLTDNSIFVTTRVYMKELDKTVGVLYSLEVRTAARQWAFFSWGSITEPAVSGHFMYAGSGDGKLYAIDTGCGLQKWIYDTGSMITSSPAAGEECVYAVTHDGMVYAII
jgi:outer membrane protein assembly factor BamB